VLGKSDSWFRNSPLLPLRVIAF